MILVALGSNIAGPWGNPRETVLRAVEELPSHGINVIKSSTLIETAPFGVVDQPNFVNAVVRVKTELEPEALMQALHVIEKRAGRERLKRWGPRTLDLDLLDYNAMVLNRDGSSTDALTLPHPGILERTFVLAPLVEVAPRWKHPVTRQSAALTLRQLNRLNAN